MLDALADVAAVRMGTLISHLSCVTLFSTLETENAKLNPVYVERIAAIVDGLPVKYKNSAVEFPVMTFLVGQTFISMVSEFEGFLVDVMLLIFLKYPEKLTDVSLNISDVLQFGDRSEMIRFAAEKQINAAMYKSPSDFKKWFLKLLSADDRLLGVNWTGYIEFKARRDLGVHNGWHVNETYKRKLVKEGIECKAMGYLLPDQAYIGQAFGLFSQVMLDIAQHCIDKFPDVAQ